MVLQSMTMKTIHLSVVFFFFKYLCERMGGGVNH